jgi:glycerophosphoryl diester phosphodiesterase
VTRVLAHRGARAQAPENTAAAFARAIALGADGVELDVRRTRDGALVVRHDPGGPLGLWAELPLASLRAGMPDVPELGEALDICHGKLVNVEIKSSPRDPDWDPAEPAAELLVECLAARGGADDVLVSSFSLAAVDRVRLLAPHVPTAYLVSTGDALEALATTESHGLRALHPSVRQVTGSTTARSCSGHTRAASR